MLQANKQALERDLRVRMLELQWKELHYLHTNFQNLATSSALLVGFGFSALGSTVSYHPEASTNHSSIWELDGRIWINPVFLSEILFSALLSSAASMALGFNLLSLFISTICIMCGPGLALRGPEGSVSLAVRHMEQQLKRALRAFGRGLIAFVVTLAFLGLQHLQDVNFLGGLITMSVGFWVLYACWSYGADIAEKFHISPELAVRGTFVSGPGGQSYWQNTKAERAELMRDSSWLGRKRWRPHTHGIATPLWRLDKLIAFPYHDGSSARRVAHPTIPRHPTHHPLPRSQTHTHNRNLCLSRVRRAASRERCRVIELHPTRTRPGGEPRPQRAGAGRDGRHAHAASGDGR